MIRAFPGRLLLCLNLLFAFRIIDPPHQLIARYDEQNILVHENLTIWGFDGSLRFAVFIGNGLAVVAQTNFSGRFPGITGIGHVKKGGGLTPCVLAENH